MAILPETEGTLIIDAFGFSSTSATVTVTCHRGGGGGIDVTGFPNTSVTVLESCMAFCVKLTFLM